MYSKGRKGEHIGTTEVQQRPYTELRIHNTPNDTFLVTIILFYDSRFHFDRL